MKRRGFIYSAAAVSLSLIGNPIFSKELSKGNWDSFNYKQLTTIISELGKDSPEFNPKKPPYAVFDWDNTSIFLDIQEAVLIYQLENLIFNATPEELNIALRKNIPNKNFSEEFKNSSGDFVNIDKITNDIIESYKWIYENYEGLKGKDSLEIIKKNSNYINFITKIRYLYEAIGGTFDHSTSYPWVTYLNTGLTEKQVRELTANTVRWQLKQPIEMITWTSPKELPGKAGIVSVSWKNGLRLVPEMQDLYKMLRSAGWDVWVCSASFVDVIKEISSNPEFGYENSENRVLAMELERDKSGKIKSEFKHGYDQTQGPGKTATIKRFLLNKYGYGPSLIAGDSEGDQNMMIDFPEVKAVIIINRLRGPETIIGKLSAKSVKEYGDKKSIYLLQGRDDNKGILLPQQKSIPFGKTEAKDLK